MRAYLQSRHGNCISVFNLAVSGYRESQLTVFIQETLYPLQGHSLTPQLFWLIYDEHIRIHPHRHTPNKYRSVWKGIQHSQHSQWCLASWPPSAKICQTLSATRSRSTQPHKSSHKPNCSHELMPPSKPLNLPSSLFPSFLTLILINWKPHKTVSKLSSLSMHLCSTLLDFISTSKTNQNGGLWFVIFWHNMKDIKSFKAD